jgi:hypothetical protein
MFSKVIRRPLAALLVLGFLTACGGSDADAEAGREIELTPTPADAALADEAPVTPPATSPTATPTPAPQKAAPAPQKAAPAPTTPRVVTGTVAAGTTMQLAAGARICTNTHKVGDRFTASLTSDVSGSNGVVIPSGSEVTLEVIESVRGENSRDKVRLAFKPVAITIRGEVLDLTGDVTRVASLEIIREQTNTTQAGKVATGAAVGAVAGQLLGKNTKSTIAGAAVGAAAGGAVAAAQTDYYGCFPASGMIAVALAESITIRV